MAKTYSEIKQEEAGTLKRNRQIRKEYKLGLGGELGRAQDPPISRQAIHQIVRRKSQDQNPGSFWGKAMFRIKRLFRKKKTRHIRIVSPYLRKDERIK